MKRANGKSSIIGWLKRVEQIERYRENSRKDPVKIDYLTIRIVNFK